MGLITNPAIEADLKLAKPSESILAEAFRGVEADPPIVAGVRIAFAVKSASIVTPLVITPALASIVPSAFT